MSLSTNTMFSFFSSFLLKIRKLPVLAYQHSLRSILVNSIVFSPSLRSAGITAKQSQQVTSSNTEQIRWLIKYLKVDSIHLSSRSISAEVYLKVVGAQNHPTIISYQRFGSKESYSFFATEHLVLKNEKKIVYILMGF